MSKNVIHAFAERVREVNEWTQVSNGRENCGKQIDLFTGTVKRQHFVHFHLIFRIPVKFGSQKFKMVSSNATIIDNGAYSVKIGDSSQNEPK